MNYYRKYRPQTVAELDLVRVRAAMEQILSSGNIHHAYLFSGPKGTGKTSAARILAKILHCKENQGQKNSFKEPCNQCEACKAIINGSHLGLIEMDAASNRGIDEIRALREKIGLAPAQGKYNVYLIDEVHMLTTEAFNALLKTLEEPPAHAVFILATTESHKIPETIISRCQEITFTKATISEMVQSLNKAVKGEELVVDQETLELIALRADGSFRDAMKSLETAAQGGKQIKHQDVAEMLGLSQKYDANLLADWLLKGQKLEAMQELRTRIDAGAEVTLFGTRLVETLRERLIAAVLSQDSTKVKPLAALAAVINQAVIEMKASPIAILPLEIAIAEWELEAREQTVKVKVKEVEKEAVKETVKEPQKVTEAPLNAKKPDNYEGNTVTLDEVITKWPDILKAVKPLNHSLEALLKSARPTVMEDGWLTIEVFYNFHKEQLEQERYRQMLEEKGSEVMGARIKLRFVLGQKVKKAVTQAPEAVKNITGNVADQELAKAAEEIFGQ